MFFITPAFAQASGGFAADPIISQLLLIVPMIAIFYFLLFRPQQQRMKEHKTKIGALRRGDTVVTAGGIIGKVTKLIDDNTIEVEIAADTRVRVVRGTITDVLNKNEPVKDTA